jgi:hypothetical protein
MNADIEFVLKYQGSRWTAQSEDLHASALSIGELDEKIEKAVCQSGRFPRGKRVQVLLLCDARVIPAWMRPYHDHYFNRLLSIDV